jgi:hypothetical protein
MGKRWLLGMVTLTLALCLIGLLTFTVGSVHSVPPPAGPSTGAAAEPETGPVDRDGLMLTY